MKGHTCNNGTTLGQQQKILAIHNGSHIISKQKPIIRIIHIVAPEIIKTDVENFRNLVQKLTGNTKPLGKRSSSRSSPEIINKDKNVISSKLLLQPKNTQVVLLQAGEDQNAPKLRNELRITTPVKREYRDRERQGQSSDNQYNDNSNNNNPNSFLSFLGDGLFMHDVNHEFPLLSFKSSFGDHHM